MNEKICFSSDIVELSEDDKPYLEMVNRVCYYGQPNLNGVILPEDTAAQFAETLVDMPVYAKCRVNDKGEPTFGSHEVRLDDEGEIIFDTIPIGVHTSVEIKDDTVSVNGIQQTLPCLFATQKIWTRNRNAVAAIKRLFAEGKLHNSWELCNNAYTFANGLKTITDYEFVGNTLLGYEYADPAYGESAKVLSISEAELMVAEALSRDLLSQKNSEEDESLETKEKIVAQSEEEIETPVVVEEIPDTPVAEEPAAESVQQAADEDEEEQAKKKKKCASEEGSDEELEEPTGEESSENEETSENEIDFSALTECDIRFKIMRAATMLLGEYCWVAYLFPEEHSALLDVDGRANELEYTQIDYVVSGDEVSVSNPVKVTLVVSPSQVNEKIGDLQNTIASLNDALVHANEEISALRPYQEAAEQAAREAKIAELRSYAENSGQFTDEELDGEEMSALFEALDEAAIKAKIADRVVASQAAKPAVEKSSKIVNVSMAEAATSPLNYRDVMHDFLSR